MATSKLQRKVSEYLSAHFGKYIIRENTRPEWLTTPLGERLELDFFIEELYVAIEVQGKQHFAPNPLWHKDSGDFSKRLRFDRFKQQRCRQKGVLLIEILDEDEIAPKLCPVIPQGALHNPPRKQGDIPSQSIEDKIEETWQFLLDLRRQAKPAYEHPDPEVAPTAVNMLIEITEELARLSQGIKVPPRRKRAIRRMPELYAWKNRLIGRIEHLKLCQKGL